MTQSSIFAKLLTVSHLHLEMSFNSTSCLFIRKELQRKDYMREKMKFMGQASQIWKDRGKITVKDMRVKKEKGRISIRMRAKAMQ